MLVSTSRRSLAAALTFCFVVATLFGSVAAQGEPSASAEDALEAAVSSEFEDLNAAEGGAAKIDLSELLGKKPIVLTYWIAGNPRADEAFVELQSIIEDGGGKAHLLGIAVPRPDAGLGVDVIREHAKRLGIRVPILNDNEFLLGNSLRVQSVPHISIIDGEGVLRLTNGGSLRQVIGYKLTVADAVRRAMAGKIETYGYLPRYYPVKELVGKECPDFSAPRLGDRVTQRWSGLLAKDKLNVLIFWSVDCPHCRDTMPAINDWLKGNGEKVNVVSAAMVGNETMHTKTREYCEYNGFVFPTLVDDQAISEQFSITSTPTIVFIGPDGVVESVMLSGSSGDFGKRCDELTAKLLGRG